MVENTEEEKTIEILQDIISSIKPGSAWYRWGYIKALRTAVKSVEKQMPKRIITDGKVSASCPCCGHTVKDRYCSNCGQKLKYLSED